MHGVNEFCEVVFQILELADENQKELLGINAGVIKVRFLHFFFSWANMPKC